MSVIIKIIADKSWVHWGANLKD